MRGQVVHVASDESDGFIRGDDGNRYPFAMADWLSSEPAVVGASVDFEIAGDRATMVCAIPANAPTPLYSFIASIGRHKGLLIGLASFALLLIALNAAMVRGVFSAITGDEHGPVKNYRATGPAKVRDRPTTEGSHVLIQLDRGQAWAGRIYLGPDGQSKWVKVEGSEAYVSIVNLAETSAGPESAVAVEETTASANPVSQAGDGSEFVGDWIFTFHPDRFPNDITHTFLRIERNGSTFLLRFTTDSIHGGYGMDGVFPAVYNHGILEVSGNNIGNVAYSAADHSIYVKGDPFSKCVSGVAC